MNRPPVPEDLGSENFTSEDLERILEEASEEIPSEEGEKYFPLPWWKKFSQEFFRGSKELLADWRKWSNYE